MTVVVQCLLLCVLGRTSSVDAAAIAQTPSVRTLEAKQQWGYKTWLAFKRLFQSRKDFGELQILQSCEDILNADDLSFCILTDIVPYVICSLINNLLDG